MAEWQSFLLGSGGAAASELLKLYELRGKLSTKRYRAMLRSPLWWFVVAGMLMASGFIAWAINAGQPSATPLQIVMTGIAARSIVRGVAESKTANAAQRLGAGAESDDGSLADMFR